MYVCTWTVKAKEPSPALKQELSLCSTSRYNLRPLKYVDILSDECCNYFINNIPIPNIHHIGGSISAELCSVPSIPRLVSTELSFASPELSSTSAELANVFAQIIVVQLS